MNSQKLAVGVVYYNNSTDQVFRFRRSLVRALRQLDGFLAGWRNSTIWACDNSTVDTRVSVDETVRMFVCDNNVGFGSGHNKLMTAAFADGADVYVGANPDGTFHPNAIRNLVALSEANAGRALLEAQHFPDEHLKVYDPISLQTSWISGACFLVPKLIFESTGGFDENIFLYCEDVDFSWTAHRCGFQLRHCPTALFHHDASGRCESDPEEAWRRRAMLVSGRYLGHKWSCSQFCDMCESELRLLGLSELITCLDDFPTITDTDHSADFDHGFSFSVVR